MDHKLTISEIAEREAPVLLRIDNLITSLRVCSLYATSRSASSIYLGSVDDSTRKLFSSELSVIAQSGLSTLTEVVKYFDQLRATAEYLSSHNGTLEGLRESFGQSDQQRTHERLRKRLVKQADDCAASRTGLEEKLKSWIHEIQAFDRIVKDAQEPINAEIDEYEQGIGNLSHEQQIQEQSLSDKRGKEEQARQKFEAAQTKRREALANFYVPEDFTNGGQVLFSVGSYCWSRFCASTASTDVKHFQEEAFRLQKSAEEYESNIADAQLSLQNLNKKSARLTDFTKGLELTLRSLILVIDNIETLLLQFSGLQTDVKQLLDIHVETHEMSADASADSTTELSEIKGFSQNIDEMSRKAIVVEQAAWLYSQIIKDVMLGGFESIGYSAWSAHKGSDEEQTSNLNKALLNGSQGQKLLGASSSNSNSTTLASRVDTTGDRKLTLLNDRRKLFEKSLDAKAKAEAKAAKGGKRSFFRMP